MAESISVTTTIVPKDNINGVISQSSFTDKGTTIKNVSLTEIQNAIDKLETYVTKVNNCGNCNLISSNSTSCQTIAYKKNTTTYHSIVRKTSTKYVAKNCSYSKTL